MENNNIQHIDSICCNIEVCFTTKLRRYGIMKWFENIGLLKERTEGFAIYTNNINNYISSAEKISVCTLHNIKVNILD